MAATTITPTVLTGYNAAEVLPATAAVEANEGALIAFNKADQKGFILLENSNATATATAKIVKGNGLQGTADLSVTLAASTTKIISIESMKYKNLSGDNKGKVLVIDTDTTATTLKVAAVFLP